MSKACQQTAGSMKSLWNCGWIIMFSSSLLKACTLPPSQPVLFLFDG